MYASLEYPKSNSEKAAKHPDEGKARIETMTEEDPAMGLPECDEYVLARWMECGRVLQGGMSAVPLTWQEVNNYSSGSGYNLTHWEKTQIITMSRVYCSGLQKHKHAFCAPPGWTREQGLNRIRYLRIMEMEKEIRQKEARQ